MTGVTNSTNFPTTPGAFETLSGGGQGDAFVAKLNPSGSGLVYSSYLGGGGYEEGLSIAVDALGGAYVTGFTDSTDFPTTSQAFQRFFSGGGGDVFVTKVDPSGPVLLYSTYFGGSLFERAYGITVDASGNAYRPVKPLPPTSLR